MKKQPLIVFYGLWSELANYIRQKMKGQNYIIYDQKITIDNVNPRAEILALFVESNVDNILLALLPKLKLVATLSTGYDHIDIEAARQRNIMVCNVPAYGENTVAEHTWALILSLTRKLFDSVKRVKDGVYDFHGLSGVDVKGKILGVVGTGHIGAHVIRIAKGFEMRVIAYDAFPNPSLASELGFSYTTLNKLLASADILTLHTPLLPATHHLINKKNIKKMKPGSYLINTARGALVDPEALAWALESNHIAGAGVDVLEDENLIQNHEELMRGASSQFKTSLMNNLIIHHPHTIVTPHNAFNSAEALQRIVDVTVDNIIGFIQGKPQNKVGIR